MSIELAVAREPAIAIKFELAITIAIAIALEIVKLAVLYYQPKPI